MEITDLKYLQATSKNIRIDIIKSISAAGSGHLGGSLGLADIFIFLYFRFLVHNPSNPNCAMRDKLVLSIGHVAPVLYASLAHAGYFDKQELKNLRKTGSMLQGHPSLTSGVPGIETASGSLGQGLSIAIGMALADKCDNISRKIVCICGDGELQEGQVWEAAMSAAHHKLKNIIAIIDKNNVQIDGKTADVMNIDPLKPKWEAFGWNAIECNGNDFESIESCFSNLNPNIPNVIIANTKMGKGLAEIENNYHWHGKAPNTEECNRFLNILV
ncbi:MAG: transketolase [Bacteroidales bacterium]|nr:transketolase [Bacteroidales bacterium]MDY0140347.1 transketolase [Bacteroidales bacterium]